MSDLGWEDPRAVLARHGMRPKRAFSQNFLVSRSVVERIAAAIAPREGELVVELGPGVGTLTHALLARGAHVVAIERDRDMLAVLRAELGASARLDIREGDAAELELASIAGDAKIAVCGNLPYAITGAIFRRLTTERARVDRATFMVQREVGDRLRASPATSAYGPLSVFVQASFAPSLVCVVPRGAFFPPPKVESAVITLRPHPTPRAVEDDRFRVVVRGAFGARRKTLRNGLARELGAEVGARVLAATGIDGQRRGETLSVEELAALARALDPCEAVRS